LGGGVGDTHFGGNALGIAETLAADAWDADRSFFLLNGSSAGNQAFLLAAVRPGDKVIVSRDLHMSLLVALILSGAVPVYLAPRLHPLLNVGLGITAGEVAAARTRSSSSWSAPHTVVLLLTWKAFPRSPMAEVFQSTSTKHGDPISTSTLLCPRPRWPATLTERSPQSTRCLVV
jgi:arginine/lysine/ornithine decarboxylase